MYKKNKKANDLALENLSDVDLQKMRNRFVFAFDELDAGRWCRLDIYDPDTESHDLLGLITHTRDYGVDKFEEACVKLIFDMLEEQGHRVRGVGKLSDWSYEGIFDWKKLIIIWNDYIASKEDVMDLVIDCQEKVEAELKTRNIVFA